MSSSEGNNLAIWQKRLTIIALALAILLCIFFIGIYFADAIRIISISIFLSYLFINIVDFIEHYIRSRAAATVIVYALILAITIFGAILVIPAIVYQVSQLIENIWNKFPDLIAWLGQASSPLIERLHAAQIEIRAVDVFNSLALNLPRPDPGLFMARISDMAMSTMTWLIYTVSIFVISFYFLLEGHSMSKAIINLFPWRYRNSLNLLAGDMDKSMQAFFKGQVVLGLMAGLVMLIVYLALGVPYALLLSAFLAVCEVVPVIGPPIGFYPALIPVAIHGMEHCPGNKFVQMLILVVIFNVLQWIKDNVIAPRYIGNVIGMHPVLIFVAILIGARLDGISGIIFALPVACLVNVLIRHLPLKPDNSLISNEDPSSI